MRVLLASFYFMAKHPFSNAKEVPKVINSFGLKTQGTILLITGEIAKIAKRVRSSPLDPPEAYLTIARVDLTFVLGAPGNERLVYSSGERRPR